MAVGAPVDEPRAAGAVRLVTKAVPREEKAAHLLRPQSVVGAVTLYTKGAEAAIGAETLHLTVGVREVVALAGAAVLAEVAATGGVHTPTILGVPGGRPTAVGPMAPLGSRADRRPA